MKRPALASLAFCSLLACSSEVIVPGGTTATGGATTTGGGAGSDPGCAVGGEVCDVDTDCCSGWCGAGICTASPPPPCLGDGASCSGGGVCCNGPCTTGVCGQTTPPACTQGSTKCVACVAQSCCPDLSACLADPLCAQSWACFDKCSQQGGLQLTCAQQCLAQYPSQAGQTLLACGNAACTSACL